MARPDDRSARASEIRQELRDFRAEMETGFAELRERNRDLSRAFADGFAMMADRFASVHSRMDTMLRDQQHVTELISGLIDQLDRNGSRIREGALRRSGGRLPRR